MVLGGRIKLILSKMAVKTQGGMRRNSRWQDEMLSE